MVKSIIFDDNLRGIMDSIKFFVKLSDERFMSLSSQSLERYESFGCFILFLKTCTYEDECYLRVCALQLMMKLDEYFVTQDRLDKRDDYYYFTDMFIMSSIGQMVIDGIMCKDLLGGDVNDMHDREYYNQLIISIRKQADVTIKELRHLSTLYSDIKIVIPPPASNDTKKRRKQKLRTK